MSGHDESTKSAAEGEHVAKAHAPHGGGDHGGGDHDEEEHSGAPEWLISFADNTALLMGFFVIMLALSMAMKGSKSSSNSSGASTSSTAAAAESNDALDLALSIRAAFNNPVSIDSTKPGEQAMVRRLKQLMADANEDNTHGRHDRVQSPERGQGYAVSAVVFFDTRHSTPGPDSQKQIADFADRAKGLNLVVEVRGHTSTNEIEGDPVAAMQLSYERAFQVGQELVAQGVPWSRIHLVAIGASERDPGELTYPDRKAQNQRVELILTSDLARD